MLERVNTALAGLFNPDKEFAGCSSCCNHWAREPGLHDSRLEPVAAVGLNIVFLSIYDADQAYTEREYRSWLGEAGFADIEVQYGAAPAGSSIVLARETG